MGRTALIAAILISGTANQPIVTPSPIFATEPSTIAESTSTTTTTEPTTAEPSATTIPAEPATITAEPTTITAEPTTTEPTTTEPTTTEASTIFTGTPDPTLRPSLCIAPQYPPFACDPCPDKYIKPHVYVCGPGDVCEEASWGCDLHGLYGSASRCHSSIEECCHDEIIQASGFGTSYCIDKSHQTTTTTTRATPKTGETVTVPGNTDCITPLPGTGGCGLCLRGNTAGYGASMGCLWWLDHVATFGLCYNSVEECCGGADACIKASRPPETCIRPATGSTCEPCPVMSEVQFEPICDEHDGHWLDYGLFCRFAYVCRDPEKAGECHESLEDCCRSDAVYHGAAGYEYCMHPFSTEEAIPSMSSESATALPPTVVPTEAVEETEPPECLPCPESGDCPCSAVKIMLRDKPVYLELEVNNQKKV